jgi:hypothetical protein
VKSTATDPLIFSSVFVADRMRDRVPPAKRDFVKLCSRTAEKTRATAGVVGDDALFLAPGASACAFVAGEKGGVIVRRLEGELDPAAAPVAKAKGWKEAGIRHAARGAKHALFNPGGERLEIELPEGKYDVERAKLTAGGSKLELLRLMFAQALAPWKDPETVRLSPADEEAAASLPWAHGRHALAATRVEGVATTKEPRVASGALHLPSGAIAVWTAQDGTYLIGAAEGLNDDLVAAALSVPRDAYAPLKETIAGGALVLSGEEGDVPIRLPDGPNRIAWAPAWGTRAANLTFVVKLAR